MTYRALFVSRDNSRELYAQWQEYSYLQFKTKYPEFSYHTMNELSIEDDGTVYIFSGNNETRRYKNCVIPFKKFQEINHDV